MILQVLMIMIHGNAFSKKVLEYKILLGKYSFWNLFFTCHDAISLYKN